MKIQYSVLLAAFSALALAQDTDTAADSQATTAPVSLTLQDQVDHGYGSVHAEHP